MRSLHVLSVSVLVMTYKFTGNSDMTGIHFHVNDFLSIFPTTGLVTYTGAPCLSVTVSWARLQVSVTWHR